MNIYLLKVDRVAGFCANSMFGLLLSAVHTKRSAPGKNELHKCRQIWITQILIKNSERMLANSFYDFLRGKKF